MILFLFYLELGWPREFLMGDGRDSGGTVGVEKTQDVRVVQQRKA
jgi:hypothetical protein